MSYAYAISWMIMEMYRICLAELRSTTELEKKPHEKVNRRDKTLYHWLLSCKRCVVPLNYVIVSYNKYKITLCREKENAKVERGCAFHNQSSDYDDVIFVNNHLSILNSSEFQQTFVTSSHGIQLKANTIKDQSPVENKGI